VFLVEPPGLVRAEAAQTGERTTHAGRSVEETLGIDWATLEAIARTTQIFEASGARMRLEPLMGPDGHVNAVLVRPEDGAIATPSPTTAPPPSSSRWARGLKSLVGKDVSTRAAVDLALRFARTSLPILISAEEGSGADIVARAIHEASARAQGQFVHVRASTIPRAAVETVLFATVPHPAQGGMLFVEDVHELDFETGKRLARELDRGVLSDAHFVCSAPPDVRDRVARGVFARELYTLVRGSTVVLPPLRDREDLPYLIKQTLTELDSEGDILPAAMDAMRSYWWPGNIGELWGCLEHAVVIAGRAQPIGREHLPRGILVTPPAGTEGLRRTAERAAVEEALRVSQGNVSAAAKRLGVARSTLYRLMQRHGLAK
jgi:transcriptional regulator of acetoin/glycerol metabolism